MKPRLLGRRSCAMQTLKLCHRLHLLEINLPIFSWSLENINIENVRERKKTETNGMVLFRLEVNNGVNANFEIRDPKL